jgi:DNA-binding FadR family transcriptional regulator
MTLQPTGSRASGPGATAASSIAEDLAQLVLHELQPGMSLPSEGELATRFEVSRLTIREAVKMLAGRGLVDLGRGRRAIVIQPSGIAFADYMTALIRHDPKGVFDLIEMRLSLEVQSSTLAAKRASRAGIAAMEAEIEGMRAAMGDGRQGFDPEESEQRFHHHDVGFHEAVALSSGNRLISSLFEAMAGPLKKSFALSRRGHDARGYSVEDTIAAHEAILKAIRAGNPKAAGAAMRAHLEDTERDIRSGLSTAPDGLIVWSDTKAG